MLNQIVIVGRLVSDPQLIESEEKVSHITLAVPRSYKNEKGEYDTDFIDCILWNAIAENTVEYCRKGDLIGVKGRVQSKEIENEDGTKNRIMQIVAEKVTFLSSKPKENPQE